MKKNTLSLLICITVISSLFSGCSYSHNYSAIKADSKNGSAAQDSFKNESLLALIHIGDTSRKDESALKSDSTEKSENILLKEYLNKLETIESYDIKRNKESLSTVEITDYAQELSKMYDDLLNNIYDSLKKSMDKDEFKQLEKDQFNWITKKEEEIKKISRDREVHGGSMYAYLEPITVIKYTHNRIYELLRYMGNQDLKDKNEAEEYLINTDRVYINNILSNTGSLNYVKNISLKEIQDKFLVLSDIDEEFFVFSLEDKNNNQFDYYVGKITKEVYLSCNKEKKALLQIKDGSVINSYDEIMYDNSTIWRQ